MRRHSVPRPSSGSRAMPPFGRVAVVDHHAVARRARAISADLPAEQRGVEGGGRGHVGGREVVPGQRARDVDELRADVVARLPDATRPRPSGPARTAMRPASITSNGSAMHRRRPPRRALLGGVVRVLDRDVGVPVRRRSSAWHTARRRGCRRRRPSSRRIAARRRVAVVVGPAEQLRRRTPWRRPRRWWPAPPRRTSPARVTPCVPIGPLPLSRRAATGRSSRPAAPAPSARSTVGATSARMPGPSSSTPSRVTTNGTGFSECAVFGEPSALEHVRRSCRGRR